MVIILLEHIIIGQMNIVLLESRCLFIAKMYFSKKKHRFYCIQINIISMSEGLQHPYCEISQVEKRSRAQNYINENMKKQFLYAPQVSLRPKSSKTK